MKLRFFRVLFFFALMPFLVSCYRNRGEEVELPYAKKQYSGNDLNAMPEGKRALHLFLWMYDSAYAQESRSWYNMQCASAAEYFSVTATEAVNGDNIALQTEKLWICPLQSTDSVPLYLQYNADAFGRGRNALVLRLCDSSTGCFASVPSRFFAQGGISAVLGDTYHDSTGRVYYLPLDGSHILCALNTLIGGEYTVGKRLALITDGPGNNAALRILFSRPEFFASAYVGNTYDSVSRAGFWDNFPVLRADDSVEYPTVLFAPDTLHCAVTAFLQERNGRKCGKKPVLMYRPESADDVWNFLLSPLYN